jgi:hypothetical protein
VLAVVIVVLIAALVFYAMRRSKPLRLKLTATVLKLASFSIEVEAQDERPERELPQSGEQDRKTPDSSVT